MKTALQQSHHFTNTLQIAGVKSFYDEITQVNFVERGPVTYIARSTDMDQLPALRRINPRSICVLNPDSPSPDALRRAGFRQLMTAASVAEIDLTQPVQTHPKWRAALRKSQPATVQHRAFDATNDGWLLKADRVQQRQKRYRAMPHAIAQLWPKHDTHLLTATQDNTTVAAMLFLIHGSSATYHIGWSDKAGRQACAHHLLLATAIRQLRTRGVERLDLGSVDTENSAGLARFKIRAGASVRPLGGTWAALPLFGQ